MASLYQLGLVVDVVGADGERSSSMRRGRNLYRDGVELVGEETPLFVYRGRGDIQAEMTTVKAIVDQLNTEIVSSTVVSPDFKAGWIAFWTEFQQWYATEHDRILLGSAAYKKALEYRGRAADWREKFASAGGKLEGPDPGRTPDRDTGSSWPFVVAGVVLGGGLLYAILRPFAGGAPRRAPPRLPRKSRSQVG